MKSSLRFTTADSLCQWLLLTTPGREILARVMPEWMLMDTKEMESELRAEVDRRLSRRTSVLIVCHGEFLEGYADEAAIHFANGLNVDPIMATAEELDCAEKYLLRQIPLRYKHLLALRPETHTIHHRTANEEIWHRTELSLVRECAAIGK